MGIDPKILSDKQIGLIGDAGQRRAVTKARGFKTQAEIEEKNTRDAELDMHDKFSSFLHRNELPFIHANPTKKSTIKKGAPDFCVTGGERHGYKCLYLEFKIPSGKLSEAQIQYFAYLAECGCAVYIVYSYAEAVRKTVEFFDLTMTQE